MGYIISINGTDGSGKTTQIDLLRKSSSKSTFFPPSIAQYGVFPKLPEKELFEWWFFNSSIEEFCTAMYQGIKCRNAEIIRQDKPLTILDKGIDTVEARIMANFMCRGMQREEILIKMQEVKLKLRVQDSENIKLFLMLSTDENQRKKITKSRKGTAFGQSYYDKYQSMLGKITQEQLKDGVYEIVDASGSIKQVNSNIIKTIGSIMNNNEQFHNRVVEQERE